MAQLGPSVRSEEQTPLLWLFGAIEFVLLSVVFLQVLKRNLCNLFRAAKSLRVPRPLAFLLLLTVFLAGAGGKASAQARSTCARKASDTPVTWTTAAPRLHCEAPASTACIGHRVQVNGTTLQCAAPHKHESRRNTMQSSLTTRRPADCPARRPLPQTLFTWQRHVIGPLSWLYAWMQSPQLRWQQAAQAASSLHLRPNILLEGCQQEPQYLSANAARLRFLWNLLTPTVVPFLLLYRLAVMCVTFQLPRVIAYSSQGDEPPPTLISAGDSSSPGHPGRGGGDSGQSQSEGQGQGNEPQDSGQGAGDGGEEGDGLSSSGISTDRPKGGRRKGKRKLSPPPEHRVLRPRTSRVAEAQALAPAFDFEIYTVGEGFNASIGQELEKMVAYLHASSEALGFCRSIRGNAEQFIKAKNCSSGQGYFASQTIPPQTRICFYTGTLIPRKMRPHSNHRMDLGMHFNLQLAIDGTPEATAQPFLGSMQMVNHSCRPNCAADHKDFGHGQLGVCYLTTMREVQAEEQITFDYKGDFWSSGAPRPKPGFKVITCRCGSRECRRPWRWERNKGPVQIRPDRTISDYCRAPVCATEFGIDLLPGVARVDEALTGAQETHLDPTDRVDVLDYKPFNSPPLAGPPALTRAQRNLLLAARPSEDGGPPEKPEEEEAQPAGAERHCSGPPDLPAAAFARDLDERAHTAGQPRSPIP